MASEKRFVRIGREQGDNRGHECLNLAGEVAFKSWLFLVMRLGDSVAVKTDTNKCQDGVWNETP